MILYLAMLAVLCWWISIVIAGIVNGMRTAWSLKHRPTRWLARRGIVLEPGDACEVVWLTGEMRWVPRQTNGPWIVGVVASDFLLLECPVPLRFRRERVLIPEGRELRCANGEVMDATCSWKVASNPPGRLVGTLRSFGWSVA